MEISMTEFEWGGDRLKDGLRPTRSSVVPGVSQIPTKRLLLGERRIEYNVVYARATGI